MGKSSWDQRFLELMERIRAASVAGTDPRPLHEEFERLMAEKPPEKKDVTSTKG